MDRGQPEQHKIAVRAFTVSAAELDPTSDKKKRREWSPRDDRPSGFVLVFDTECTVDAAQRLRVGAYQLRRDGRLVEAGFFFEPGALDEADQETLEDYVAANRVEGVGLELLGLGEFTNRVLYRVAYELNALIVGFNLPFDISRVARSYGPAKRLRGGFTFRLGADHWPHVQVKHLSSKAAIIQFESRRGKRGYFCDAHTLAAALMGKSYSLAELAKLLNVTHKGEIEDYAVPVSKEFLDYAMGDVQTTWECFAVLNERYRSHGLSTPVSSIYSEASIGKAYLDEMGIRGWRRTQPDFPPEITGAIMSTYHGGRAEVHIRRQITSIAYLDFLSQYTTCCVLMGLWRYVIGQGMSYETGGAVATEIQRLLDRVTADELQDRAFWPSLATLVKVRPEGDIFPVQARYGDDHSYTTGVNYLTSPLEFWFTLADCIASKLLTGKAPVVTDALRFQPKEPQDDLRTVDIAGNPDYRIEPAKDDFYKRLIELRSQVKKRMKEAEARGDGQLADQLKAEQQALKVTASATSYGIYLELNVERRRKDVEMVCFGPQGSFPTRVRNVEEPGRFFHPLLGTVIAGAARLLLALAEQRASIEGLSWVLCDTDSIGLAQPDGMSDDDFRQRVTRVHDWVQRLNPYETDDELLRLEDENFALRDGKVTEEPEKLYAFAVSAKRYCLFNRGPNGQLILRRGSAHGLGYLHPPYDEDEAPPDIPPPVVPLRDLGLHRWEYDLWYRIVEAALGPQPERVDLDFASFDKPAASRYAATTPELLGWFARFNQQHAEHDQVRPFGFLLAFQADPLLYPAEEMPRVVSPYDRDPTIAARSCFDRKDGSPVAPEHLKTYLRALAQYHLHPEAKFLGADFLDSGPTVRRHVVAEDFRCVGKQANRWDEQAATGENPEAQIEFIQDVDVEELRAGCRPFKIRELARAADLSPSAVSAFMRAKGKNDRETLVRLRDRVERLAQEHAEQDAQVASILARVDEICRVETIAGFARRANVDRRSLQSVLRGRKRASTALLTKLQAACDASFSEAVRSE